MRDFPQGFTITRESPDGLAKVEYSFAIVACFGGMDLRATRGHFERRSRRCKWVHKPGGSADPVPADVREEARERFCRVIGEMLEE